MTILLWRVLDHRVAEACLAPALWLGALITAFVLLPSGSGLEAAAGFNGFIVAVYLVCKLIGALAALE
jgi:hypothetical protein